VIEQELSSQYGLTAQFPDSSLDSLRRTPAEAKTLCALSGRSMANIYLRLLRSFALRRRPAPPSFGSINSIPAASKALFTTANVARLWRKSKCECRRNGRLDVERCGHPWDGRVPHQALDIFDSSPGVALVLRARGSLSAVILPDIPAYWSRYAYGGYPYPFLTTGGSDSKVVSPVQRPSRLGATPLTGNRLIHR
jgi:hypothetical protein